SRRRHTISKRDWSSDVCSSDLNLNSDHPFKGNMDIDKLRALIEKHGADKIGYVRMEAGTNLIGGQPHSLENMKEVRAVCDEYGLKLVYDASLLSRSEEHTSELQSRFDLVCRL